MLLTAAPVTAQILFDDVSATAGIAGTGSETWGAAWGELNGDIYPDLYTSNHRTPGQLLQNNGDGTFSDRSVEADLSAAFYDSTKDKHGAIWADLDGDGDQDLLTTVSALESPILINDAGILTDKRSALGLTLGNDNGSRMPIVLDIDNDGRLDLKLVGVREKYATPTVFRQQPDGSFTKLPDSAGLRCLNAQWAQLADLNGSGTLEFLCGDRNGFPANIYDLETGSGTLLPAQYYNATRDAISGDFDGNLQTDLIYVRGSLRPSDVYQATSHRIEFQGIVTTSGTRTVTIDTTGVLSFSVTRKSWNYMQKDGSLDDIYIGATGYHPASEDLRLDPDDPANRGVAPVEQVNGIYVGYNPTKGQWKLVFRAKNYFSYGYFVIDSSEPITAADIAGLDATDYATPPVLMLNNGGTLMNAGASSGLLAEQCISGVAGDFDNDMDLDLFLACRDGAENIANVLYENDGSGAFTRLAYSGAEGATGAAVSDGAGTSESVVTADYDVDGFLDLYVTNGLGMRPAGLGGSAQLFQNRTNGNHWVELDLRGTASNRDGIGARVLVTAGGITQYREQNGGYHRWSQNHMRLHVGLGTNRTIDEIRVLWPSGATEVFTNVAADYLYRVTEGDSALEALHGSPGEPLPNPGYCGRPLYDSATEQAAFLWQDCDNPGRWHLRVTAGGAVRSVYFQGRVESTGGVKNLSTVSVETADILDTLSEANALNYRLGVWGKGYDGIGFSVGANACFTPELPDELPVYLGAERERLTEASLDMTTGKACAPKPGPEYFCGAPAIRLAKEQATFLWQDCETGLWNLQVTAGDATQSVYFTGRVHAPEGVTELSTDSVEDSDVLDTRSNPAELAYRLGVWGKSYDRIGFRVGSNACFAPDTPAGNPVYLGAERVLLTKDDINLSTGDACDEGKRDSDGDGLDDSLELEIGTNPLVADTDGGGVPDGAEFWAGADPLDGSDDSEFADSDGDGLSDAAEALLGTDPNSADSDGGGADDGDEIAAGTDPLSAADDASVNTLAVQFRDISVAAGIAGYAAESWGAAWADHDGDSYPDLYTSNHRTPGRLFHNNGDGTFADISLLADRSKVFSTSYKDTHAASWADIDNDGDQDLAMAVGGRESYFLINDNGLLTESRAALGISASFTGEDRMPVFFDLNNDGLLDLKMVNWNETADTNTLFLQSATHSFAAAPASAGMDCIRGDWAQFTDLNGSGPLEMLCGGEKDFPTAAYDYAGGSGARVEMPRTTLVNDAIAADFDGDLRPDLLQVRGRRRVDQIFQVRDDTVELHSLINHYGTRVFTITTTGDLRVTLTKDNWNVLQKSGSLKDVYIGAGGYQPAGGELQLAAGNPANQGLRDIANINGLFIGYDTAAGRWQIVFNARRQFSSAYLVFSSSAVITGTSMDGIDAGNGALRPVLLLNKAGGFVDSSAGSGLAPVQCISGVAGDFDNDMDQDIYLACRSGAENLANILYENRGNGVFDRVNGRFGAEGPRGGNVLDNAGIAESVAMADIDVDGFLDLLVTNGLNMRPLRYGGEDRLFRNEGNANHWVQFDLVGTVSNRDAMGAKLVATAGGIAQYREQNGGYHRWSQNHKRVHFGLADHAQVDEVTITWPSGLVETYTNLAADTLYTVTEGEGLQAVAPGGAAQP